jgi:hypothetical protein
VITTSTPGKNKVLEQVNSEIGGKILCASIEHLQNLKQTGGVAQWASHPPQEREDPGSNPSRV